MMECNNTYRKEDWFQSRGWEERPRPIMWRLGLGSEEEGEAAMEDLGLRSWWDDMSVCCQAKLEDWEASVSNLVEFLEAESHQFPVAWNWSSAMASWLVKVVAVVVGVSACWEHQILLFWEENEFKTVRNFALFIWEVKSERPSWWN